MILLCVWILRRTLGEEPLAVSKSFARIQEVIPTTVGHVGGVVLMGLFVVMGNVWMSKMILSIVVLVTQSVKAKIGALLLCVIMVGNNFFSSAFFDEDFIIM